MNSALRLQTVLLRQCALRNTSSSLGRRSLHSTSVLWKDYPPHIIFALPALSPTMETGTIAAWALKPGDTFGAGDVLCSIETDKATMDFEAQDDGILAKILKEGPTAVDVPCGTPICVIVEEASDVEAFADFEVQEEVAAPVAAVAAAPAAAAAAAAPSLGVSSVHPMLPSARFLAESKYVYYSLNGPHHIILVLKISHILFSLSFFVR
jgi:pyruvate/2-oxoglutarate dehydrogenase complex dihydrolipoamide acyltransferase (E2) component